MEDYTTGPARPFKVRRVNEMYVVEDAPWLHKIMETVNPEDYEAIQYFERVLQQNGIIQALEEAGVQDGDTVSIYGFEFDFVY